MPKDNEHKEWHLDKKLTVSIILVLVMNVCTGVWVVAMLWKDVETLSNIPIEVAKQHDQIIRLQEHDKLMDGAIGELKAFVSEGNQLMRAFGSEQSSRGPRIKNNEDDIKELQRKESKR